MKPTSTMSLTTYSKIPDYIFFCLTAAFIYFKPMLVALGMLSVLVTIDLITGILLAKHNNISFSFKKALISLYKIAYYTLLCVAGFIIDKQFIEAVFGAPYMFNIFVLLLALNEFRSIVDNISIVMGIDIWRMVIKAFNKKIEIDEK